MPRRTVKSEASTSTAVPMDNHFEYEEENQNIELLVRNFVKYIINYSANKLPIKKNELSKQLKISQKQFPHVLSESTVILKEIYGIELIELAEAKPTKLFLTYPTFKLPTALMLTKEMGAELRLLFIILSYIFMKSGEVQEGNLIIFLEKIHVNLEEFANARDKFVKQLYLKSHKKEIEGQNEEYIYYSWGERALLEFNKQEILEQVAKLMKKPSSNFIVQHQEVYGADPTIMDFLTLE